VSSVEKEAELVPVVIFSADVDEELSLAEPTLGSSLVFYTLSASAFFLPHFLLNTTLTSARKKMSASGKDPIFWNLFGLLETFSEVQMKKRRGSHFKRVFGI